MTDEPTRAKRPSVRLSRSEAWAMISETHTGIFTTLRRDGWPIALPVWFVALDECVYLGTPRQSKKMARLAHDARASFLVESGERWAELCAVHLTGTARVVDPDDPALAAVERASAGKYDAFRTERTAMPTETAAHYDKRGAFAQIRFTPDERILSWDNSRLELGS
jgi:nitroimidazol reductase NimA-like FMN-containing flavoprotein (pyridoxamine 5'-phosphate oxidase superfamily)